MSWYYSTRGIHVHVKVYFNGALCGMLCFRLDEFEEVKTKLHGLVSMTKEDVL